jgi:ABC-2 type transport system permease protein
MSTPSNPMPESVDATTTPGVVIFETRPWYWSVRRELWENRAIYIAPLTVAAVVLFGSLFTMFTLPRRMRALSALEPAKQLEAIGRPYHFAALILMGTTFIVALYYCLEALYGERRDRSILFWKSMPVSDLTTVLSKAIVPVAILPVLTFAITFVTQGIILLLNTVALLGSGLNVATYWTNVSFFHMSEMLLFHLLAIHGLWYAPMYAWLLLVSAWARRAPVLWALLPLASIGVIEKIVFNSAHFAGLLMYRFGGPGAAESTPGSMALPHGSLGEFLMSPGLWLGLLVAAGFLAAAVRIRRYRESN